MDPFKVSIQKQMQCWEVTFIASPFQKPAPGGAYLLCRHWLWASSCQAPVLGTDTFTLKSSLWSSSNERPSDYTGQRWLVCPPLHHNGFGGNNDAVGRSSTESSSKGQPHCSFGFSLVTEPCWTPFLWAFLLTLFCVSSWRHFKSSGDGAQPDLR